MHLRVAVVAGNYTAVADGVGLTTQRQAAHLHTVGDDVRVFTPAGPRAAFAADVPVVPVSAVRVRGCPYPVGLRLPVGKLGSFRPNVLHITTPDWLGWQALRWARRHRVPVVSTFHTHFPNYARAYHSAWLEPAVWRMLRAFYSRCDHVLVGCDTLAEELTAKGICPTPRVLPAGVDVTAFGPNRRCDDWRRRHGFGPTDVVVAYVGRLAPEKSLDVFAAVAHRLTALGLRYKTLIVGDGPVAEDVKARLPYAVFTGTLRGEELTTAFASADVFLFPSASETFGCVTVEALASGLAAVVADAPGSRDIIRHGIDGLVCPPGDVPRFAAAVEMLIRDPSERSRLRDAGPPRAAMFGWESVLTAFRGELCTAATGRGSCPSG